MSNLAKTAFVWGPLINAGSAAFMGYGAIKGLEDVPEGTSKYGLGFGARQGASSAFGIASALAMLKGSSITGLVGGRMMGNLLKASKGTKMMGPLNKVNNMPLKGLAGFMTDGFIGNAIAPKPPYQPSSILGSPMIAHRNTGSIPSAISRPQPSSAGLDMNMANKSLL